MWAFDLKGGDVTIGVWACLDQLLPSYDYGTKVCCAALVMDLRYQSVKVSHVRYMTHSWDHYIRMSH